MAGEPGWVPPGVDIKREGFELVDPGVVYIPAVAAGLAARRG
jgi:hypothetical protein